MKQKIYQVDAFTDSVFSGNPAAVCILEEWLDDITMQNIAMENNLAETAFSVKGKDHYEIRWFTPEIEVDLCGHATLATAYVLFHFYDHSDDILRFFSSRSGELSVQKSENGIMTMDFPTDDLMPLAPDERINNAIGAKPSASFKGKTDYLLIYDSQSTIKQINPSFHLLDQLDCRGVIVSAKGDSVDFVSRFFAPKCGISEDPVTGSAHTTLTPYWSKKLGKNKLSAKQLSQRGGNLICEHLGKRVKISGNATR